jgi:hypothetical protein
MGDQEIPGRIGLVSSIPQALRRARIPILTIALTYFFSLVVGAVLVHSGNKFSVNYRDKLVAKALATDPASIALRKGENLKAALWDFSRNLVLGAVPSTLGGLGVLFPYPFVAFRGWVGGIVSIDSRHKSRLADPKEAFYYILTLILQLIPYSLAGGAGVALGLSYYRPKPFYLGKKWFGLSREAVLDVFRIYLVVIPLFLIASLWEFLAR